MSAATFTPAQPREEQAFVPMAGLGQGAGGFVLRLPQDMVRHPQPDPVPEVAEAPPPPPPPAAPSPKPVILTEDLRAKIYAEGYTAAQQALQDQISTARIGLEQAAQRLDAITDQMSHALEAEVSALAQTVSDMVRQLAAERAGTQISADPAGFAERIFHLAEQIADEFGTLRIALHPDDLAALSAARDAAAAPVLEQVFKARLRADPALARGDLRIKGQGLAVDDLIGRITE